MVEFDLGTGVGVVAQLVLQALHGDRIQAPVGQETRHEQAAQAAGRLRQYQEGVAHGCREEPLVAGDGVALAPAVLAMRRGTGGVGAHVGAALLFRHAHADGHGRLLVERDEAFVVGGMRQLRAPGRVQRRVGAQCGCGRITHRHRAQHRWFGLGEEHEGRGAFDMTARPARPGCAVQAVAQGAGQQRVVAGVELDLVDAAAMAVVRVQHRQVGIGASGVGLQGRRAGLGTQFVQARQLEFGRVQVQRVAQRPVGAEQVDADIRRALVCDFVGGVHHGLLSISRCGMLSSRYSSPTRRKPQPP